MKTTIFSSLALLAIVSLCACQGSSTNNSNSDSTSISKAPDTTSSMGNNESVGQRDTASSGKTSQTTVDAQTREFMNKAAMGGMAEVEMGKLAQQNASSPRVKNFGDMMVRDHSSAND